MLAKGLSKRLIALGLTSTIAISGGYLIAPFEGGKKDKQGNNIAYLDIVGIPTICAGWISGVKLGDKKSDAECEELLAKEVQSYNKQMKKNVHVPLSPQEEIAFTSFVWNVGIGAWNSSTALKKLNSGDNKGACNAIMSWNKVTVPNLKSAQTYIIRGESCSVKKDGKSYSCTVKGLTNRRTFERDVCLGNNSEVNSALKHLNAP